MIKENKKTLNPEDPGVKFANMSSREHKKMIKAVLKESSKMQLDILNGTAKKDIL